MPDTVASSATDADDNEDKTLIEGGDQPLDANTGAEVSSTPDEGGDEDGAEGAKKSEDEPKSLLDAVMAAVEPEADKDGDTPDPDKPTGDDDGKAAVDADAAAKAAKDGKAADADDDESKPPPFHEHPRWKKLVAERDDLKAQAEKHAPVVEQVQALQGYLADHDIKPESYKWAVSLMGQVSRNPAAALPRVRELLQYVETRAGSVLPADLQEKVDSGLVDADSARELSMARQSAALTEVNRETDDSRSTAEADATFRQEAANTVSAWEEQWAKSDPDYEVKKDRVRDKLRLALSQPETYPKTLAQVGTLVQGIRTEVETEMKGLLKQRKPMKSARSGSSGASGAVKAEPKSLMEAMELSIA